MRKRKVGDKVRVRMGESFAKGQILYAYPKQGLFRVSIRPTGCEPISFDVIETSLL